MSKNKIKSSYPAMRSEGLGKRSYRSNTLHRYSPRARMTRLFVTLGIIFAAFILVLAFVVFPKIDFGKKDENSVEALPTPNPTPNPYGTLVMPEGIELTEDIPSWVKTDVYGQPVALKSQASASSSVIMTLVDRENVIVKGIAAGWSLVEYNNVFGFIQNKFIFDGPIPNVPEVINMVQIPDLISGLKKDSHLVNVQEVVPGIIVDMELAKDENYLGTKMYPVQIALLQEKTAEKLKKAQGLFNQDGYSLVLWDAYRPYSVTLTIAEMFAGQSPLIDSADRGSRNNRGTSVDVTIVKKDGTSVEMPTEGMTLNADLAARIFANMDDVPKANVKYMSSIMRKAGFMTSDDAWWHFDDTDWQYYPVMDYDLFDF